MLSLMLKNYQIEKSNSKILKNYFISNIMVRDPGQRTNQPSKILWHVHFCKKKFSGPCSGHLAASLPRPYKRPWAMS